MNESLLRQMAPAMDVEQWLYQCAAVATLTVQDNRWQFAHDKLRELVVTDLSEDEHPALHRQVAEAIEAVYPDDQAQATTLVQHWHMASNTDKERYYARIAGEQAHEISDFRKAINLFSRALEITPQQDDQNRAVLLVKLGNSGQFVSEFSEATRYLEEGLALARYADDWKTEFDALNALGWIASQQGNFNVMESYNEQALPLAREGDDPQRMSTILNSLATAALHRGDDIASEQYHRESLEIKLAIGNRRGIASTLHNLGVVDWHRGDYAAARHSFEESLPIVKEIGYRSGTAQCLYSLGFVVNKLGDYEAAEQYHRQSLAVYREIGSRRGIAFCLIGLGEAASNRGDLLAAEQYHEESLAICREVGDQRLTSSNLWHLGHMYVLQSDERARAKFKEALAIAHPLKLMSLTLGNLVGFAWLELQEGRLSRSGELAGLVKHHPHHDTELQDELDEFLSHLEKELDSDELEAVMEQGKALDLDTVVAEIVAASDTNLSG